MTSHANGLRKRIGFAALLLTLSGLSPNVLAQPNDPSRAFGQNVRFDPRSDLHGRQLLTGPGRGGSLDLRPIGMAYLWDLDSGRQLQKFEGHVQEITAVAFLPNGKRILTGAGRPALGPDMPAITEPIRLLEVETGREIRRFEGHTAYVEQLEVSADGSRFVAVAGGARVWDTNTGQLLCVIRGIWLNTRPSVRFDLSGTKLVGFVAGRGRSVKIWDASTGAELATMACDSGTFEWVEFSPDGNRVLTSSSVGAVRIFDWRSGKELQSFVGHATGVIQASFFADGQKMIIASSDMSVRVWDVNTGKELKRLDQPGAIDRILLSGDGKRLLSRWRGTGMSLWNVESGKLIRHFSPIGAMSFVGFLPATQSILIGQGGKPETLFDGATGEVIRQYD